jgi:hypothetical protein
VVQFLPVHGLKVRIKPTAPTKFQNEDEQRLAFLLDREPSEVVRITEAFRMWIEQDVGPLYEWKKAKAAGQ